VQISSGRWLAPWLLRLPSGGGVLPLGQRKFCMSPALLHLGIEFDRQRWVSAAGKFSLGQGFETLLAFTIPRLRLIA